MTRLLLVILLMVSSICQAHYSNHQLYQAYLDQDMTIWEDYITSADWDKLNVEEKKQLLNYEYGFTAYILSKDADKAKDFIARYEQHIEALKNNLSEARYYAYITSLHTYKLALDKAHFMGHVKKIFASIERAMELDSKDALVLFMKGNVEFYNPIGSKKQALEFLQKADSSYRTSAKEYEQWNHHAVRMTIEQCKEKLNK